MRCSPTNQPEVSVNYHYYLLPINEKVTAEIIKTNCPTQKVSLKMGLEILKLVLCI